MKIGPRELIVFGLLLAFLAGAWMLGFRRLGRERAFYVADMERKRTTLTALQQHAASVDELESQLSAVHKAIEVFERRLPRQKEVDVILGDVWQMGERNALRRPSVRPLRAERAGAASEQPIELTFQGEFPGILGFLSDLEASDRIVRITQLECKRESNDLTQPLSTRMTLNIYFEPDGAPTGTTASASGR